MKFVKDIFILISVYNNQDRYRETFNDFITGVSIKALVDFKITISGYLKTNNKLCGMHNQLYNSIYSCVFGLSSHTVRNKKLISFEYKRYLYVTFGAAVLVRPYSFAKGQFTVCCDLR